MNQKSLRCPTCGITYSGDQKFCNHCGSELIELEGVGHADNREESKSQVTKKKFQTIDNSGSFLSPTVLGNGNININIGNVVNIGGNDKKID